MQTGDAVIQYRFALTADAAGHGYRWFLWMGYVWQSLICWYSHTAIAMTPKLSPISCIRRKSITKWRFNFIFTLTLSFSSCLSMFLGRCITVWPKSLPVDGWYLATPGQSRSRQNFIDSSSDSDSRRNGRLRPTPTPASTPTPQPCPVAAEGIFDWGGGGKPICKGPWIGGAPFGSQWALPSKIKNS